MKNKTITLICILTLFFSQYALAQVSINTTGNSPNASAMLDVESDSKGLLIPRLTTAQRTTLATTAVDGLLVFDSEEQSFYIFGNGAWINLSSSAEIWSQSGSNVYLSNSTMNVGIGTLSPTLKLDVRGESPDHEGVISLSNSDQSHMLRIAGGRFTYPDPYIQWKEGDNLRFVTDQGGWNEKMRITSEGKVGIGTTAPATYTMFHVVATGSPVSDQLLGTVACFQTNAGTNYSSRVSIIGGNVGFSILDFGDVDNQSSGSLLYNHNDNFLAFNTDNTEKMRIESGGNVGIGTITPNESALLDLSSTDKGFLPPRMTEQERENLSNPARGLMIYCISTNKVNVYNGSDWYELSQTLADDCSFLTVVDIDGNTYNTVKIGGQCWLGEDLKVKHYPNGDAIPHITDNTSWGNLADTRTDDAYCFYNNISGTDYGALYTYAAAIGDDWQRDNVDGQGVCPDGWHIPSYQDLDILQAEISGDGGSLKEIGTTHWNVPNTGAADAFNFTALPGGCRSATDGTFLGVGINGYWWGVFGGESKVFGLNYNNSLFYYYSQSTLSYGNSVRCLRD